MTDSPRRSVSAAAAPAPFRGPLPRISVVIPLRDEAPNLAPLAAELREALDSLGPDYELLFVDDGSVDDSRAILHSLAERDNRIRPLVLDRPSGQSAALSAGFEAARGTVIVTLDADLQNDPADIPALVAGLERADVVSGIRRQRHDAWRRRASSAVANRVRRLVLGDSIRDIGCSLKAYRAGVLRDLPRFDGMHRFLPALAELGGARVEQLAVGHRPRRHGRSKYGLFNRLWRALADLLAVSWMTRRRLAARPGRGSGDRRGRRRA